LFLPGVRLPDRSAGTVVADVDAVPVPA
jgi:hypothetical protein